MLPLEVIAGTIVVCLILRANNKRRARSGLRPLGHPRPPRPSSSPGWQALMSGRPQQGYHGYARTITPAGTKVSIRTRKQHLGPDYAAGQAQQTADRISQTGR